jgi:hypothetical protein
LPTILQCWASDNFCGQILIWSDQIRKTPVFSVFLISDLIWWFPKKLELSDRNLIKTPKTLFLCALQVRLHVYCRGTYFFLSNTNYTHYTEVHYMTFRRKRTATNNKNAFHQMIIR